MFVSWLLIFGDNSPFLYLFQHNFIFLHGNEAHKFYYSFEEILKKICFKLVAISDNFISLLKNIDTFSELIIEAILSLPPENVVSMQHVCAPTHTLF